MTSYNMTDAETSASRRSSVFTILDGILNRWIRSMNKRATIRQLERLDDRELRDIGMTRDSIKASVRAVYKN
jgi:uncharacterized protein YjiS (DUF1127 family)